MARPLQGVQVWFLVGKVRSHKPHSAAKRKRKKEFLKRNIKKKKKTLFRKWAKDMKETLIWMENKNMKRCLTSPVTKEI